MARSKGKLVYSTRGGDQRKKATESAGPRRSLPPQQQDLRIQRETKGRRGKTVTVITGFALTESDLKQLTKQLKSLCGAGGTAKNEAEGQSIEIQGDHRDRVAEKLNELGYRTKFSGG